MVRLQDPATVQGFAPHHAAGHVVGLAFVLVAVVAIVVIAVFSCTKSDNADLQRYRPGNKGDGVSCSALTDGGGGGGCGGGGCGGGGG